MKILIIMQKFNRDVFVYDKDDSEKRYGYMMPLGLPCISAYLKRWRYDVDTLNLNHHKGNLRDVIQEQVRSTFYDVIFMGGTSIYFPNIRDYMSYIREVSPESKIVLGGGLLSAQPELMMKLLKPDYGIICEGEISALRLVRSLAAGITIGPLITSEPIPDLDILPYPDLEGFGFEESLDNLTHYIANDYFDHPRTYPLLSTRGCPYHCTFCFHTVGKGFRYRSIESIMGEVRYATKKYGINVFVFEDELFTYDRERAFEFCRMFKEFTKTVSWEIRFMVDLRADCADAEMLAALKDAGLNTICMGLESYSPVVLKSMKKNITQEQIRTAVKCVADNKMALQSNFLFGDPAETIETAKETLEYFKTHRDEIRGGIWLQFVIPFQGSRVYQYCLEQGIIKDEVEFIEQMAKGYDVRNPINMTKMSDKEFEWLKEQVLEVYFLSIPYVVPAVAFTIDGKNFMGIECPYCKEVNIIRNGPLPQGTVGSVGVGCRHCSGRFNAVTKWYPLVHHAVRLLGFKRAQRVRKLLGVQ